MQRGKKTSCGMSHERHREKKSINHDPNHSLCEDIATFLHINYGMLFFFVEKMHGTMSLYK